MYLFYLGTSRNNEKVETSIRGWFANTLAQFLTRGNFSSPEKIVGNASVR